MTFQRQYQWVKMSDISQNTSLVISHKKGVPVYASNPSILNSESLKKRKNIIGGGKGFVIGGGGEIVGQGAAVFYEYEEVDNERFIKLFVSGFKQTTGLSKSGLAILEIICLTVQDNPNTDEVKLSYYSISKKIEGLTERTYQRGLRELLDKEFIFRSPEDGVFFINIRYLFNGNRLAFVKGYERKVQAKSKHFILGSDDEINNPI